MRPTLNQRGFSLVAAILVLVVLTALAVTVLSSVNTDTEIAGQNRASEAALHIAEAGVAWGMNNLRTVHAIELDGSTFTSVFEDASHNAYPRISSGDGTCGTSACPLFGWRELTTGPEAFGGGTFRVAVNDDADDTVDTDPTDSDLMTQDYNTDINNRILMRVIGTDSSGSRRVIEVALSDE